MRGANAGVIDEEEMRRHPRKSIVTSAVQAGGIHVVLFIREYRRAAGDAFLLCCDGVWEAVSVDETEEYLTAPDAMEASEELCRKLLATECRNNVSFVFATP